MKKNNLLFTILSEGGAGYHSPEIEVLYCGADAPLLDSPGGGFSGDEGGLEIDDLD